MWFWCNGKPSLTKSLHPCMQLETIIILRVVLLSSQPFWSLSLRYSLRWSCDRSLTGHEFKYLCRVQSEA